MSEFEATEATLEAIEDGKLVFADNYIVACFGCGTTSDLQMVAHRNEKHLMVGWLFVCADCFETVSGERLVTWSFAKHYVNQMGRWVRKHGVSYHRKGSDKEGTRK